MSTNHNTTSRSSSPRHCVNRKEKAKMLSIMEVEIDVETSPTTLISKALPHIKLY